MTEREVQAQGRSEETVDAWARQARGTQEELKQTEARTAELSGVQTFLSMADRLSWIEVLSIVRDLNEVSTKSWSAGQENWVPLAGNCDDFGAGHNKYL